VFRCIYSARNADYQAHGALLGQLTPLRHAEVKLVAGSLTVATQMRAWDYWLARLEKEGATPKKGISPTRGRSKTLGSTA
jgi:hypothetical protein